jgi:hypothetical protein
MQRGRKPGFQVSPEVKAKMSVARKLFWERYRALEAENAELKAKLSMIVSGKFQNQ